ncbi:MAG: sirohydrochlorin cobaltochelatase, partial [Desulfovibrio sp.]|nr:sirohydrochlorin cobaltochelatase [Desulfovibrio sp.]
DMAGQSRHSWRSRLEELGHQCVPVLKGTMEHNAIAEIWLEHLLEAAKLL